MNKQVGGIKKWVIGFGALLLMHAAVGQEDVIRKTIAERLPKFPSIDEVRKTPIPGLYEIRVGTDVFYSDRKGEYLIQGHILETKTGTDITEERIAKLTAIDFGSLPLKDAVVWKQGTGARKIAVFADPNCGYCKRFERDLQNVKDITVYTFLMPILGPDSNEKSRNIWCAPNITKAWRDWMLDGAPPPKVTGQCDASALERNLQFGAKHKVNGTPAVVFENGKHVAGAMTAERIEQQLVALKKTSALDR